MQSDTPQVQKKFIESCRFVKHLLKKVDRNTLALVIVIHSVHPVNQATFWSNSHPGTLRPALEKITHEEPYSVGSR